uniref:Uncharacterized protein n=1 Tax=Anguilla anguilla TaxID=7936 RepID=A0A0E9V741_ANGAN
MQFCGYAILSFSFLMLLINPIVQLVASATLYAQWYLRIGNLCFQQSR